MILYDMEYKDTNKLYEEFQEAHAVPHPKKKKKKSHQSFHLKQIEGRSLKKQKTKNIRGKTQALVAPSTASR